MFETTPTATIEHSANSDDKTIRQAVKEAMICCLKSPAGSPSGSLYRDMLKLIEQPMLHYVMARTRENRTHAAKLLGLSRGTLRLKLKTHDLL